MTESATQKLVRFGVFELNLATEELRKAGTLTKLAPQPFRLLAMLALQSGKIVTREEIQQQLWGEETYVDFEQGMNHCIKQIRTALHDNADNPLYIETLPRKGYRFIAPVVVKTIAAAPPAVTESKSGIQTGLSAVLASRQAVAEAMPAASPPVAAASPVAVSLPPATVPTPETVLPKPEESLFRVRFLWVAIIVVVLAAVAALYFFLRVRQARKDTTAGSLSGITARPSVAVLGFRNLSGRPDTEYVSTALSEFLNTELAAGDQLRTVTGDDVATMKENLALKEEDRYSKESLARIRKNLNVDQVVGGSYYPEEGDQLLLNVWLQDTRTGETLLAAKHTGSQTHLDELVRLAGAELREKLGVPAVSETESAEVSASIPSNPEVARLYSEGLAKLRVLDTASARDYLQKAVAAGPGYASAHSALAEAWKRLGYDHNAAAEAKKAFDLSANLSREEKLCIAARYREINHEWDKEVELYQELWRDHPDNVEYGLSLAAAQTSASKANDALDTIAKLRTLPPPSRDDPRIDLQEAYAANSQGNWQLAETAAGKVAKTASTQGMKLLMAQAQMAEGRALYYQGNLPGAMNIYNQMLETYRQSGDRGALASALNNIANVLQDQGDLVGADQKYREALDIYREIGAQGLSAGTLSNMGALLQKQRKFAEAEALFNRALALDREVANRSGEATDLTNLGEVQYVQGNLAGARSQYGKALAIYLEVDDQSSQAYVRSGLGEVLTAQDDLASARQSYEQALAIREKIGEESASENRLALAALSLEEGNPRQAEAAARKAVDEFSRRKAVDGQAQAQVVLAKSLLAQANLAEATRSINNANALVAQIRDPGLRLSMGIEVAITEARIHGASGRPHDQAEATASLERSLSEATKNHLINLQLQAALALGELEIASGHSGAGQARLQALQQQAGARGFTLIARKAAAAAHSKAKAT